MIIKRLRLENYRRFRQLEIDYPENIIGIIGKNGTGKSTIVEAIGWSLYGNRMARTDKSDIRSQFCDPQDRCRVEIDFNCNGSDYRIIRTLKGKNAISEAAIYREGMEKPIAEQDRGVNEFIESLIGLDYRSFIASVFAKQKELAVLSQMQPEERRRSVNRLIGIDVIDRARENLRKDRNEKDAYANGLRAALKDVDKLKEDQKKFEQQIAVSQQKLEEAAIQMDLHKLKLSEAKTRYEKIQQMRDRYNDYFNRIEKFNGLLAEAEKRERQEADDLNRIIAAEQALAALTPEIKDYDAITREKNQLDQDSVQYAALQGKFNEQKRLLDHIDKEKKRLTELQSRLHTLGNPEAELIRLNSELEQLELKEAQVQVELQKARSETHTVTEKGKEIKEKKERVENLGPTGECPVCTQTLGSHYEPVLENFEQELKLLRLTYKKNNEKAEHLEAELLQIKGQLKQVRHQREHVNANLKVALELKKSLVTSAQSVEQLQLQQKILDQEIHALEMVRYDADHHVQVNKKYSHLTEVMQKSVQLQERASRKNTVEKSLQQLRKIQENYTKEIGTITVQKEELNYEESLFIDAGVMVEKRTREYDQIRDRIADLKQDRIGLEKERDLRTQELREQEVKRIEIENLKDEIAYLDALERYFGEFRLALAGRLRPLIAEHASTLLAITTDGRYSLIDLDDDYNISVYDGTEPFQLERFSGGEQDLVNLCLRIAISQVLAERASGTAINFIVLDEIFGSQDEERKELILSALNKLQSQFRQIFIITHIETIKDVLPVLVQVEEVNELESLARMI